MLPSLMLDEQINHNYIDSAVQQILSANNKYEDLDPTGRLISNYYTWKFYSQEFQNIKDLLLPIFNSYTGLDIIVDHSHILDSFVPYQVHSDWFQERMLLNRLEPAYTIIIPLDTCPTATVAFNQNSTTKDFKKYIVEHKPEPIPDAMRITNAQRERYLSHIPEKDLNYLTIKEIFHWKKGSIYFCDRRYFHCSDNYIAQGLTGKRAMIFWTSVPK